MGGSVFSGGYRRVAVRTAILAALVAAILSVLAAPALAGTETGEFCPTCPDWSNLDGWLAQKEAYEKAQQNAGSGGESQSGEQSGLTASSSGDSAASSDAAGYVKPDILASAGSLSELSGDWVILDVRSASEYSSGHIPGARNLYWKDLEKSDGEGLDAARAIRALGEAGAEASDRIIIYGGESGADNNAAFVFWALSYLGSSNVSLLDGGVKAAEKAGIALTDNASAPASVNYTASPISSLLVTPEDLQGLLSQADVRILDARDFSDYGQSRLGNEAICLSSDKIYESSGIADAATLNDLFERRVEKDGTVIVYGTPEAYSLFFSLELMGYNATLLEGDWWQDTEWAVSNVK